MSLAKDRSGIEIPDRMRTKLEKFQKKVWIIKLAEGLLAAAFGLLVSYLLVFVLDRFFDTSALARTAILIAGHLGWQSGSHLYATNGFGKTASLNKSPGY